VSSTNLPLFTFFWPLALEIPENPRKMSPNATCLVTSSAPSGSTTCTTVFASVLAPSTTTSHPQSQSSSPSTSSFFNLMSNLARSDNPNAITSLREPISLSLSSPLYLSNNDPSHFTPSPQPALSATALLQKAAQMGASSASLLRGLGLTTTSPPSSSLGKDEAFKVNATTTAQWNGQVKQENQPVLENLGLGLPCGSGTVTDVIMDPSTPFVGQPMTRDLLGLSIGGGASRGGLSALVKSFGGNFDSPGDGGVRR